MIRPEIVGTTTFTIAALFSMCLYQADAIKSTPIASHKPKAASKKMTIKKPGKLMVYIGTYTGTGSKGIYIYEMNRATGHLTEIGNPQMVKSPSFLAFHPSGKFLYAANETNDFNASHEGGVSAFSVDQTDGMLKLLNQEPSGGDGPCFVAVDKLGVSVLVANYGGGSVSVLPIMPNGKLGAPTMTIQHKGSSVNKSRQEGPHAHSINMDETNTHAYVADLGLDRIYVYPYDAITHSLNSTAKTAYKSTPGAGPRHLVFHPNGKNFYVINELANSISVYVHDPKSGADGEIQRIGTLPLEFKGVNSTAEVQVSPNGKFVYGSNRGSDTIAMFAVDPKSGKLSAIGHQSVEGKTPRNFRIDPAGNFMVVTNQDSDNVVVLKTDKKTGLLSSTGLEVNVPRPVCVKFLELPVK